jgi:uncharacterized membrane protein YeiH
MLDTILLAIEIVGVISFAVAGAVVAIDKETDLFGVVFLALMTCFGGGIIRDITIGRNPPAFFRELTYQVLIGASVALLVFILARVFKRHYVKREQLVLSINNYIDALAIGIYSVSGVQICLDFFAAKGESAGFLLCAVLGMMTAVGGGMIRDLILRDIPFILRKRVYALATLISASIYYLLVVVVFPGDGVMEVVSQLLCIALVVIVRVLATKLEWNLPKAIIFSEMEKQETEKEAEPSLK